MCKKIGAMFLDVFFGGRDISGLEKFDKFGSSKGNKLKIRSSVANAS